MPSPLIISCAAACRFLRQALGLAQTLPDTATALQQLEFVQMDSINVCGRMHDLILRSRLPHYRPADLEALLYDAPRTAFEYYFPNLCVLPLSDYPYFVPMMQRRATQPDHRHRFTAEEGAIAQHLLAQIAAEGPLRTRASASNFGHTLSGWGTPRKLAAHVLEKLWFQGQLVVHHRENFERWFDLPQRTLPPHLTALHQPDAALPDEAEELAFQAHKRLRSRRIFRPRRQDLQVLGRDAVTEVAVEGCRRSWYVLTGDGERLAQIESEFQAQDSDLQPPQLSLLAPLDPVVYDRDRTRELFQFDYSWEVYTPAAKRRWGYYVLPMLWGDRLVGRVDPKFDRASGSLKILALQLEPGIEPAAIAPPLALALTELAQFLGAERLQLETIEPASLRQRLLALNL